MMTKSFLVSVATLLIVSSPVFVGTAKATLFNVELIDNDGPHIIGQVNSLTDSFTITSWTENPGGTAYWTPADLPRTYNALTTSGTFDVPDNWDGTISATSAPASWAFINPAGLSFPGSVWNEGNSTLGFLQEGWGGAISGGSPNFFSTESSWIAVPFGTSLAMPAVFDSVSVAAVPEPSTFVFATLGLLSLGLHAARRRRRA